MIARSTPLPQPIPFNSSLSWSKPAARPFVDPLVDQRPALGSTALNTAIKARIQGPVAWASALIKPDRPAPSPHQWAQVKQGVVSANDPGRAPFPGEKPATTATATATRQEQAPRQAWPAPKERPARQALARYDGPHSLSVRSAASGRHYRFEHQGVTQVIDAMDIALMRRIEDITLL
jgi:hypothetical protein